MTLRRYTPTLYWQATVAQCGRAFDKEWDVAFNCKKGSLEKGKLPKIWFSCTHVPLLLLPVAALWTFVFKCDARNGPLLHHRRFQNPAPLKPQEEPPQCGNLRKIFGKMRKLSEIVFLTSWTSNTVKQGVRKMSENVGNLAANFLRTPEVQSALQTPLCTALSSFQFCSLGFSRLVAHWHHNSQRFEPSISLPNSHGAFAHNQAMEK